LLRSENNQKINNDNSVLVTLIVIYFSPSVSSLSCCMGVVLELINKLLFELIVFWY